MKNSAPDGEAASDLAQRLAHADPLAADLGVEYLAAGAGHATLRLQVVRRHLNFMNTCHGGVIFALADCAFALAANSHGAVAAAIDAHITYQIAVVAGDTLTATAQELSRSNKLAVHRVDVTRQDGALVSTFTGTVYITAKRHAEPVS